MVDDVPLPRPRPATPIPLPPRDPRKPWGQRNTGTGQPTRHVRPSSPQRTQPVGYGALRDPMANADPHNEVPNAPPAEVPFDPEAAQARVQLVAERLRAAVNMQAPPPGGPAPSPLDALRARVDTTFKMPSGIPYEQLRTMSIRNWERWAETGAGTSEPPVMDPLHPLINPEPDWLDGWDSRRTEENTARLMSEIGVTP